MNDYETLKKLIEESDNLIEQKTVYLATEFIAWHEKTRRFLLRKFGENSTEFEIFKLTTFRPNNTSANTPANHFVITCALGLRKTKGYLIAYLDECQPPAPLHQFAKENRKMGAFEVINDLYVECFSLLARNTSANEPSFQAWHLKVKRFLIKQYGKDSFEYTSFNNLSFSPSLATCNEDYFAACNRGLNVAEQLLKTYLDETEQEDALALVSPNKEIVSNYSSVFIVHGHNGEMKEAVARLLEKQNINAIILHEQANLGTTIIEKIERYSDTGAAICLFTGDDIGKAKTSENDRLRARQNVVFEAGYFIGKLGRNKVVIISDSNVEMPSDLSGVVYSASNSWKFEVLQELKAMGYSIDMNRM